MRHDRVIVLKFGGSVLRSEDDLPGAVHEAYRWVRAGWRVVAVVSALEGETASLLARAGAYSSTPHVHAAAALASAGERVSAALLTLALDRAGLSAELLDEAALALRTAGEAQDAAPVALDTARLRDALKRASVVVAPGFVGRDARGRVTLLGRGGSDLTALFIGERLNARCRLIKDVDGLYEWDPDRDARRPRRYGALGWEGALALDGSIVQHKGVRFAMERGFGFEVAGLNGAACTRVGDLPASFHDAAEQRAPLRVALLGLGVVGQGVLHALAGLRPRVRVVAIAVRDRRRAVLCGAPVGLLCDAETAARASCDVLVECMGGVEPASGLLAGALSRGVHVVTANKAAVAARGPELEAIARSSGASLRCSAAVGGCAPMLEAARRLSQRTARTVRVDAVLNATTNYVLDRACAGASFDGAIADAQAAGFAERDPARDLSGRDAADKLALLHHALTGEWISPDDVDLAALCADTCAGGGRNRRVRHVASLIYEGEGVRALVRPCALPTSHPLARTRDEWCAAVFTPAKGERTVVTGRGAGRWPTAEAVVADLLDLQRELPAQPRDGARRNGEALRVS